MTRCSIFTKQSQQPVESTMKAYSKYVFGLKDPTIYFHISGGANIKEIVANYRENDVDNLGNAILIQYNLDRPVHLIGDFNSISLGIYEEILSWNSSHTKNMTVEQIQVSMLF